MNIFGGVRFLGSERFLFTPYSATSIPLLPSGIVSMKNSTEPTRKDYFILNLNHPNLGFGPRKSYLFHKSPKLPKDVSDIELMIQNSVNQLNTFEGDFYSFFSGIPNENNRKKISDEFIPKYHKAISSGGVQHIAVVPFFTKKAILIHRYIASHFSPWYSSGDMPYCYERQLITPDSEALTSFENKFQMTRVIRFYISLNPDFSSADRLEVIPEKEKDSKAAGPETRNSRKISNIPDLARSHVKGRVSRALESALDGEQMIRDESKVIDLTIEGIYRTLQKEFDFREIFF